MCPPDQLYSSASEKCLCAHNMGDGRIQSPDHTEGALSHMIWAKIKRHQSTWSEQTKYLFSCCFQTNQSLCNELFISVLGPFLKAIMRYLRWSRECRTFDVRNLIQVEYSANVPSPARNAMIAVLTSHKHVSTCCYPNIFCFMDALWNAVLFGLLAK